MGGKCLSEPIFRCLDFVDRQGGVAKLWPMGTTRIAIERSTDLGYLEEIGALTPEHAWRLTPSGRVVLKADRSWRAREASRKAQVA